MVLHRDYIIVSYNSFIVDRNSIVVDRKGSQAPRGRVFLKYQLWICLLLRLVCKLFFTEHWLYFTEPQHSWTWSCRFYPSNDCILQVPLTELCHDSWVASLWWHGVYSTNIILLNFLWYNCCQLAYHFPRFSPSLAGILFRIILFLRICSCRFSILPCCISLSIQLFAQSLSLHFHFCIFFQPYIFI